MSTSINIFAPKNTLENRKLSENTMERFNADISIHGRTKYEDKDNMIHSLQEEINTMKYKMTFYFEKEKEIQELKETVKKLEEEIKKINKYKGLIVTLKKKNDYITDEYRKLLLEINDFERIKEENKLLQDKLNSLSQEKDDKLPTEKKSLDMIIEEITNELNDNIDETIEDIGNTEDMQ
ncbi:MAG: hypothetical protein CMO38_00040 [Verrucomicrobiaceae bacterium]|nr:hypothetical protein [Verrucomicrobiaceae bacterium]